MCPDLLTLAKGLGAGYQPIGAVMVADHVLRTFAEGSGFFQHSHTYMGHPVACAAGNAVIDAIEEDDLLANVRGRGRELQAGLGIEFGQHPHVGDIRGRGLLIGIEIVKDRSTKEPFEMERKLPGRIKAAAMAEGLMVYPMGGTNRRPVRRPCFAGAALYHRRQSRRSHRRPFEQGARHRARRVIRSAVETIGGGTHETGSANCTYRRRAETRW